MKRRTIVAIAAALALLVAGAVTANAASLGSLTSGIFGSTGSVAYPSATRSVSALTLTTSGTTVTGLTLTITGTALSNLDGQSATVSLQNSGGTQVQSVTGTLVSGGNLTIGTTSATATLAVAGSPAASSFAGWAAFVGGAEALGGSADATQRDIALGHGSLAPAAPVWENPVIPASGESAATEITAITPSQISTSGACLTATVTGTSATAQPWSFTVDYSKPPFYGVVPQLDYQTSLAGTTGTVMTLVGRPGYATLTNAQTLNILVCSYSGVVPQNEPSAYTVSAQVQGATWSSTQACVARTITGNGSLPFYFGWATSFDLTAAINLVKTSDSGAPRVFVYHADPTTPASYTAGTTTYGMVSYAGDDIEGTGTYTAQLCVSEY
ncbi:MAG: hypothetical protein WDM88_11840 [Galbitalea sp.]